MKTMILLCLALVACGDPRGDNVTATLKAAGYTDIHLTGWAPFGCSDDDTFATGFNAKGPSGAPASGTVCSNLVVKGSTIRLK
jgi:hypothetical protein